MDRHPQGGKEDATVGHNGRRGAKKDELMFLFEHVYRLNQCGEPSALFQARPKEPSACTEGP